MGGLFALCSKALGRVNNRNDDDIKNKQNIKNMRK